MIHYNVITQFSKGESLFKIPKINVTFFGFNEFNPFNFYGNKQSHDGIFDGIFDESKEPHNETKEIDGIGFYCNN